MPSVRRPDSLFKILSSVSALYHHISYSAVGAFTLVILDKCQINVYNEKTPVFCRNQC